MTRLNDVEGQLVFTSQLPLIRNQAPLAEHGPQWHKRNYSTCSLSHKDKAATCKLPSHSRFHGWQIIHAPSQIHSKYLSKTHTNDQMTVQQWWKKCSKWFNYVKIVIAQWKWKINQSQVKFLRLNLYLSKEIYCFISRNGKFFTVPEHTTLWRWKIFKSATLTSYYSL